MSEILEELLAELEAFGRSNDAATADRARKMLNITRDTGEFLGVLLRAMNARRVLEIGTSNGYSTLWLASAAREIDGHIVTVEHSAQKIAMANANFARAGLANWITILHDAAERVLEHSAEAAFDVIFLDSDRAAYVSYWPLLKKALRPGGLLVADNAISHAGEMAAFMALLRADPDYATSLVPVGNGEFLAVRRSLVKSAD